MMDDCTVLEYRSPASRPHYVGLPNAEIRVREHVDGRWMWGISFSTSNGGEGFYPLAKWNRFAESRRAAIEAGVSEFLERIGSKSWTDSSQIATLRAWAEAIVAPVQSDLFGVTA